MCLRGAFERVAATDLADEVAPERTRFRRDPPPLAFGQGKMRFDKMDGMDRIRERRRSCAKRANAAIL